MKHTPCVYYYCFYTMATWEVESIFDGSGGALFGLYCSLDMRSDGGCRQTCLGALCGASIIYTFPLIANEIDL